MDENRYYYKQSTITNNASDDSSYTGPMPWITKGFKSRLGKHRRNTRVLQDVVNVEPNEDKKPLAKKDDIICGDSGISNDFFKPLDTFETVDLIKPLDLLPELNYKEHANDFIKPVDLNQDLSLSKLIEPSHDISCSKPLDLHQELNISKSFDLQEQSFIRIDSPIYDLSFSRPVELQESSFVKIDNSKSEDIKPIFPLDFALKESNNLPEPISFPSQESSKKCENPPINSNHVEHQFKPPPPPSKEENKNDFQFEAPLPVSSNPKTCDRPPTSITVKGKSYRVIDVLGSGGSSLVYLVQHPENSEFLAIKRVNLTKIDESIAEGYIEEVKLLKNLQKSESIIKMFDHELICDSNKKLLHVVMEKGDTDLCEIIRNIDRTKKQSIIVILYYWLEMLSAVLEVHNNGVIHSDLKPANFLLVKGKLKLIDFGIASSIQGDMTSVYKDAFTGTLNYMSPEAVHCVSGSSGPIGYKITYKTDVWSLGCILYNLIYGRLPFQHLKKKWDKVRAIVDPKIQIEFPEVKGVPAVLMEALKSCLDKDPKKRMSVSQLLELPYCGN